MSILVFGAKGQVGSALVERGRNAAAGVDVIGLDIDECDICDQHATLGIVTETRPAIIINCAAYTAVDRAETDAQGAYGVNQIGAQNIARAAARYDLPIIHISTDYVYAGIKPGAHTEDDPIAPANVYGITKAAGDAAVNAANPRHLILRVSWVFSAMGNNFVKTMLRLGQDRPELRVVNDQVGGPTEAGDIADTLLLLGSRCREPGFKAWGLYHYAGAPAVSWFDFAQAIFKLSRGPKPRLLPIPTSAYPLPARRPLNSRLDCRKIKETFGIGQPDWRQSLERVITRLEG